MEFTAANTVVINEDVVFRSNKDGSVVVMKMNDDDLFYKINGVAAEMWQKFAETKGSLGEISETLSKEYSVSVEQIMTDAQPFIKKMLELKIVKIQ